MATQRNYRNLGFGVTTRLMSWEQAVRDAEGSRWNLPTGKFFFGDADQFVFVDYVDNVSGPGVGIDTPPNIYSITTGLS